MKVLVLSCNIGGISRNTTVPQTVDFDFIKLDDSNFPLRYKAMQPRLIGKIPKMLGWELYPDYDAYIWIDAPYSMKKSTSIQWYLDQLGDNEIALFRHPSRNSIKEEMEFCVNGMKNGDRYLLDRYEGEPIEEQVNSYLKDQYFKDNNLFACTSFIYSRELIDKPYSNQTPDHNIMKEWFYHNCRWGVQDQLSLPYLLYTFKTKYKVIEGNSYQIIENL